MQLKTNVFYIRRDGTQTIMTKYHPGLMYCFESEEGHRYTAEGKYDVWHTSPLDIMREHVNSTPVVRVPVVSEPVAKPTTPVSFLVPKKNKHAAIIKAWADGELIEYKGPQMTEWKDLLPAGESMTLWRDEVEYRVKDVVKPLVMNLYLMPSVSQRGTLFMPSTRPGSVAAPKADRIRAAYQLAVHPETLDVIEFKKIND
jgi:hypothetical protein